MAERFAGARQIFTQQLLEEIFSFNEIATLIDVLHFQINENRNKLNKEGIEWIENLKNNFLADKTIGLKFMRQRIEELMKEEPVIEKNVSIQKELMMPATHFEPKFSAYQQSIQNHPLITEHKEAATVINEYLNAIVIGSLHYKLFFALLQTTIFCYLFFAA